MIATFFIALSIVSHLFFFLIESILFKNSKILAIFRLTKDQGDLVGLWAFNQGFYNLFFALGLLYSLYLKYSGHALESKTLSHFILMSMTGAGLVLFISSPHSYKASILQALPPFLGLLFLNEVISS